MNISVLEFVGVLITLLAIWLLWSLRGMDSISGKFFLIGFVKL